MSAFEIPLSPEAQTFRIKLNGVTYTINLYWNSISGSWCIDLADSDAVPIINGIPVVANTDLLEQYAYLNLGGKLIVQTDSDPNAAPTDINLGTDSHLYFVTA